MADGLQLARTTAEALNAASLIGLNHALTAVYWRIGSLKIGQVSKYPGLAFVGPSGSGKSTNMNAMKDMDMVSTTTVSCIRLTTAEARDQLGAAKDRTIFCEEFDQLADPKSAMVLFHSRSDRNLSTLAYKAQHTDKGAFHSETVDIFGATVTHSRNDFDDPALSSRFIVIPTRHQSGPFVPFRPQGDLREVSDSITLMDQPPGKGRIHDTWWPVLCVAAQLNDSEWIEWATGQIELEQGALLEAGEYDRKAVVLGRIIEVVSKKDELRSEYGGSRDPWERIDLHHDVGEPLRKNGYPDLTPWQVNAAVISMGMKAVRSGGRKWLHPSPLRLALACERVGLEDDWIEGLKSKIGA